MIKITPIDHRRFLLGKQGLYPGRRWHGKDGAAQAVRACEAVQIDPLNITARNHDLTLFSRVLDYQIDHLDTLAHQDRAVFDYGSLLFYYPIEDLPYFRAVMRWWASEGHYYEYGKENGDLIAFVRDELKAKGPLGNRHFEGNARVESYRASKDTGLALRYLWITGELHTHSRNRFERLFHFRDGNLPDHVNWEASRDQALDYFTRKALNFIGIGTQTLWSKGVYDLMVNRHPDLPAAIKQMIKAGDVIEVEIRDRKGIRYMPAADLPLLETVMRGEIPQAWAPISTTTNEEVTFIAPLEIVSARSRAKDVFDFDYKWEVYVPAPKRRWGYYCLPILYGDRLVGRFDPKMDRKANHMQINAFYLEDDFTPDAEFADALGRGLARFVKFNGAASVDTSLIKPADLRKQVKKHV
jgi:uncharacterized protein YcaQ